MRKIVFLLPLVVSACAMWKTPDAGPTSSGLIVRVKNQDRRLARRDALENVLPLFIDPLKERDPGVEAVLKRSGRFVGLERRLKTDGRLVEIRMDRLSEALRRTGAVVPAGYESDSQIVLIAFGDRSAELRPEERLAADAFEVAMFGRGQQAKDVDDQLIKLKNPIHAKSEEEMISQARQKGWGWLITGQVTTSARREARAGIWRATAQMTCSFYALTRSTQVTVIKTDASSVDVSSSSALTRAIEQSAEESAIRVDQLLTREREGRATLSVLMTGRKDLDYIRQVVDSLRRVPGVAGASLLTWKGADDLLTLNVYVDHLTADVLGARLLQQDPSLRVDAIETQDGRLTLQGPDIPANEDRGQ
jgi:hypothetical protein